MGLNHDIITQTKHKQRIRGQGSEWASSLGAFKTQLFDTGVLPGSSRKVLASPDTWDGPTPPSQGHRDT